MEPIIEMASSDRQKHEIDESILIEQIAVMSLKSEFDVVLDGREYPFAMFENDTYIMTANLACRTLHVGRNKFIHYNGYYIASATPVTYGGHYSTKTFEILDKQG